MSWKAWDDGPDPRMGRVIENGHQPSNGAKKKNTKKWCKGKPGREHVWGDWYDPYPNLKWRRFGRWLTRACENCGRKETGRGTDVAD